MRWRRLSRRVGVHTEIMQGAIIAQVALTALSLPNLSQAHWTARAFLLFATVAGCLSVYYACKLQRVVGKLYRPGMIRDWLRAGSHVEALKMHSKNASLRSKQSKAALSAIFLLSAPYTMMSYSILAFIIGLAIYQGFTWTRALDTAAGQINSRNVFIAYIVSTGYCQIFFMSASVVKVIESWVDFGSLRPMKPASAEDRKNENDDTALQLEENSANDNADTEATSTQNAHPVSQQRGSEFGRPYGGLAAALEAAAKAHILSAEADRRVASEYAKLSRPQEGSTTTVE